MSSLRCSASQTRDARHAPPRRYSSGTAGSFGPRGRGAALAAARRRLCERRYAAARRAAVCMQRASRGLLARRAYGSCRAAAIRISALQRARASCALSLWRYAARP